MVARFAVDFARQVRERAWAEPRMFVRWNEELPEVLRANPIVRVPGHILLLGRVLGLLSGVSRSLESRVDLLPIVLPWALGGATPPRG
jgi:hypothetical protein